MIQTLQKRFILTAMIAISVFVLVLLGITNGTNAFSTYRQNDDILDELCGNAAKNGLDLFYQSDDTLQTATASDGIPEAINEKEEAYGTGRLVEKLNMLRDAPQRETLEGVIGDVRAFAGQAEQFDDITMIGFTYLGGEGERCP